MQNTLLHPVKSAACTLGEFVTKSLEVTSVNILFIRS